MKKIVLVIFNLSKVIICVEIFEILQVFIILLIVVSIYGMNIVLVYTCTIYFFMLCGSFLVFGWLSIFLEK